MHPTGCAGDLGRDPGSCEPLGEDLQTSSGGAFLPVGCQNWRRACKSPISRSVHRVLAPQQAPNGEARSAIGAKVTVNYARAEQTLSLPRPKSSPYLTTTTGDSYERPTVPVRGSPRGLIHEYSAAA